MDDFVEKTRMYCRGRAEVGTGTCTEFKSLSERIGALGSTLPVRAKVVLFGMMALDGWCVGVLVCPKK